MTATHPVETLPQQERTAQAGAFVERMFGALIASMELNTVHVGLKLGLYQSLATQPATAPDLAARATVDPRYAREWLEQQAAAGILSVDDVAAGPDTRSYALPPGHADALTNEHSPFHAAPIALLGGGAGAVLGSVVDAFRHGTGISFGDYGDDVRHGQGGLNRAAFDYQLVDEWLPAIPGLTERLRTHHARVLDVGCGVGWSTIALARAFDGVRIDGIDSDEASIADARRHAQGSACADRISFEVRDAALPLTARYDAAFVFEALHDMAQPVASLRSIRDALDDGGVVVVMDEAAAESFTVPANEIERLLYAVSVLHCLPVGMSEPGSAATGAVMRPDTVRRYAAEAGYTRVEVLPIENDFFRFYLLVP